MTQGSLDFRFSVGARRVPHGLLAVMALLWHSPLLAQAKEGPIKPLPAPTTPSTVPVPSSSNQADSWRSTRGSLVM